MAYPEPQKNPTMLAHQLIISMTFTGMAGTCTCDEEFGEISPGGSLDVLGVRWAKHSAQSLTGR